jgi:FMN phosphatase YigB (HAD superfamily)
MIKVIENGNKGVFQHGQSTQNIIFDLFGVLVIQESPHQLQQRIAHGLRGPSIRPVNLAGTLQLLQLCKDSGHRLFALSNLSIKKYNEMLLSPELNSLLSFFDDVILSEMTPYKKPDPSLFAYLCDKHNLNMSDCIFIDDQADNIDGAHMAGIARTILSQDFDLERIRLRLFEFGILPFGKQCDIDLKTGRA